MKLPVNQIILGDSREVLQTFPANSVDSIVTDPPAGIDFMGKDWDNPDKYGVTGGEPTTVVDEDTTVTHRQRLRQRDGFIRFMGEVLGECYRVLKPGGHMLVWSIPRTSHWTATAIEEAGFEVRDSILHAKDRTPDVEAFLNSLTDEQRDLLLRAESSSNVTAQLFGSGFPKSLNISKAIDKMAGAERRVIREGKGFDPNKHIANQFTSISPSNVGVNTAAFKARIGEVTEPATPEAKKWDGWGTGLKPAVEVWWLVRKPIEAKNTVTQVLTTGTGAINVDGTRIKVSEADRATYDANVAALDRYADGREKIGQFDGGWKADPSAVKNVGARWPANLVLSHGPDCLKSEVSEDSSSAVYECGEGCPVRLLDQQSQTLKVDGDGRGASRFFATFEPDAEGPFIYATKASRADKNADLGEDGIINKHPTVKGQGLMTYLVRLVTPPNGIVLDPFTGSGSTLVAAVNEGFKFVGIERDADYHKIAHTRVSKALAREQERISQMAAFESMDELPQE